MDLFQQLLTSCSNYKPVETWRIQLLDTIQSVPKDTKHIQILHSSSNPSDGHWVCSFYDIKNIYIYDSLNNKSLHVQHKQFLERLFPTYDFEKNPVKFPIMQHQPNYSDCGVFAIAFAISLLFNIKPEKVNYEHKLMRSHLLKIFETNIVEHFPQDSQYGVPQKVLPLVVIKAREAEALAKRIKRQNETEQQKLSRLKKRRENNRAEQNKFKSSLVKKNIAQNIIRKYNKFWSKNYIQMNNSVIISNIIKKLDIKDYIKKRLEAEKIVRWSLHIRNNYIRNMYKILAVLKKRSEIHLTIVTDCLTNDDRLHALCGVSRHTASSENYFFGSTYHTLTSSESLVTNMAGYKYISPNRSTSKKSMVM
ncbi:hypothetical protein ALC62_10474 [Cyphomyrmex costatus]|uniref:Ubiquitin-like protease family profile domain-containing protein n=1 Tax=Cyphomyrmex costatus TaxID=456900 RepID=A0A151IDN1_9HYME|nr:hypothetical protein ALC62_10474 [Cyphomyrmex costatus]